MRKSKGREGTVSVLFRVPLEMGANQVAVCGEWNGWSHEADIMERLESEFCLAVELEVGRSYRFRYLLDDDRWENDVDADAYVPNGFGSDDSVVDLTALAEAASEQSVEPASEPRTKLAFGLNPAGEAMPVLMLEEPEQPTENGGRSRHMKATKGGIVLWGGTISFGLSTVLLLAVLSRHGHQHGFSGLSTIFGLFFVASLIPSGAPLIAAARIADGDRQLKLTAKHYVALVVVGAVLSPAIGHILHLPVAAVAFIWAQVIVAMPLAIRQGALIAVRRFSALGGNFFVEGGGRILFGTVAGLKWGMTGLAAGLALAAVVALITIPTGVTSSAVTPRPTTSMIHTWLSLVLLGLFVQIDILIAPTTLTKSGATHYDLAAVPSKGVYLVLAAASTFIFPYVREHARRRTVVLATVGTVGLGLAVTAALLPLRGLIGEILGQHAAGPFVLVTLGVAMSIAGGTGVVVYGAVALGVARPWPPLLLGILALFVVWIWPARPSADAFAVAMLASQAVVMAMSMWLCLKRGHEAVSLTREGSSTS